MIANHYPLAFATRWNWLIFGLVLVIGAVIRHFYNSRHKGLPSPWWTWGVAAAGMVAIIMLSMAGPPVGASEEAAAPAEPVDLRPGRGGRARPVQHVPHAASPPGRASPCRPRACMLDTPERIVQHAARDPAPGGADPRHAARQHHRDHARGAAGPGRLGRRRRQGRVADCMTQRHAVRGRILTFIGDPAEVGAAASHRYLAGRAGRDRGRPDRRGRRRRRPAADAAAGHAGRPLSGPARSCRA